MKTKSRFRGIVYLTALIILLPWAAYSLAVKKTVSAWKDCRKLDKEISITEAHAGQKPAVYELLPDSDMSRDIIAGGEFMETVSGRAREQKVTIERFAPFITGDESGIKTITAEMDLAGGYVALIKVINSIEKEIPGCRIMSVSFHSTKELRTGKDKLTSTIIVQQIILT